MANELRALRAGSGARNERTFDVHARYLFDTAVQNADCTQHFYDFRDRCGDRREQERRRPTVRVIVADRSKRFGRCLHRVAPQRAMDLEIDESRREIISAEIDRSRLRSLANFRDFPLGYDNLKFVANCIWQNESSV